MIKGHDHLSAECSAEMPCGRAVAGPAVQMAVIMIILNCIIKHIILIVPWQAAFFQLGHSSGDPTTNVRVGKEAANVRDG